MDNLTVEKEIVDISGDFENIKVVLTPDPIDIIGCIEWAKHPSAGAISTFIGTTRDNFEGHEVISLEYSCYPTMALSEIKKLCFEATQKFGSEVSSSKGCQGDDLSLKGDKLIHEAIKKILVVHRLGTVAVCEISILIAVSTPHRELGLEACKFLIDAIKKTVPIWKKEFLNDGSKLWK